MDDKELIRLYENRDERAIVGTAEKYGSYCRSIGTNILHSSEDCEECFDDALMKLWESIPPDKPRDLGAYLATAMRNLALSRYRKRTAQKRSGDQVALALDELSEVLPDSSDVAEQLDADELMQGVNEFLRSLPKKKTPAVREKVFLSGQPDRRRRIQRHRQQKGSRHAFQDKKTAGAVSRQAGSALRREQNG